MFTLHTCGNCKGILEIIFPHVTRTPSALNWAQSPERFGFTRLYWRAWWAILFKRWDLSPSSCSHWIRAMMSHMNLEKTHYSGTAENKFYKICRTIFAFYEKSTCIFSLKKDLWKLEKTNLPLTNAHNKFHINHHDLVMNCSKFDCNY